VGPGYKVALLLARRARAYRCEAVVDLTNCPDEVREPSQKRRNNEQYFALEEPSGVLSGKHCYQTVSRSVVRLNEQRAAQAHDDNKVSRAEERRRVDRMSKNGGVADKVVIPRQHLSHPGRANADHVDREAVVSPWPTDRHQGLKSDPHNQEEKKREGIQKIHRRPRTIYRANCNRGGRYCKGSALLIFSPLKSASIASQTTFSSQARPRDELIPTPRPKPTPFGRAPEKSIGSPSP